MGRVIRSPKQGTRGSTEWTSVQQKQKKLIYSTHFINGMIRHQPAAVHSVGGHGLYNSILIGSHSNTENIPDKLLQLVDPNKPFS